MMTAPHLHSATKYRADIDGLRALAVLPVVLFHIGVPGFFGGFVGVDVFFVISGYLITGIIARELAAGQFSIVEFYRRRVVRIFPALFAMLAVVSLLAVATMLPSELVRYGKALAATSGFASNFVFYQESGYFAPDGHTKALLHTWSLAVEEQFYLFWPLILAGLHARGANSIRWIAAALTAASFALAIWLLGVDPSAAFFLIPTRAWELMVGALIAVMPLLPARHRLLREVLAAGGILGILAAVKFYNAGVPFPGPAALLPILSAAAIIVAGGSGSSLGGRLLSWRPVVFIGKISFSLYLWHWPVIVFAQVGLLLDHSWPVRSAEFLLSLLLGYLSWRYIEQPTRLGAVRFSSPRILGGAVAAMALSVLVGAVAIVSQGLPQRYDAQQLALARYEDYDGDKEYRGGSCFVVGDQPYDARCLARPAGQPTLLLLGDSHAAHLWPGLARQHGGYSVLQATHTGCRPLLPAGGGKLPACEQFARRMLTDWLPQHPVDVVVLAGRWEARDLAQLPATIAAARRHARQVIVVGPIPQYAAALPRFLVKEAGHDAGAAERGLVRAPFALDPQMRALASAAGASYVSLIDGLCQGGHCRTLAAPGVPLQFDYGHLTRDGSAVVATLLMQAVQPAAAPQAQRSAQAGPAEAGN
ncbi:acyltransferase family protein [Pseudoduganella sp. FT25W]|uniref:Acyltransferase family protein n=1 Tax=Duganella alba TaxID=2666081 RepID=A0A6L5QP57_9BURK|nr:acyltransferase family protein [Duganella alba]MRX11108.1 acyltransferase family protein [Duganella alba]MRX19237.1 acyltransferase family protein [Duganella alba]